MTQRSHKFVTSNSERSLCHVVSTISTITHFLQLWRKSNYHNAAKDSKGIAPEREASITKIHTQSVYFDVRITAIAMIENFLSMMQGSLATQGSLVKNLCDSCVTSESLQSYGNQPLHRGTFHIQTSRTLLT